MAKSSGQYSEQESQRRLEAALRGAFKTPPLQMKDIPKKNGESRAIQRPSKRLPTKKEGTK
jgi:hypothetical protein